MSVARRRARLLLGAVAAVAIVEWIAAAFAYRSVVDAADWEAARAAVEALPEDEPVWLATPWLGPRARMAVPRIARLDAVARPDLRGAARFHVLGLGDAWSSELSADLEDLPPPRRENATSLGPLTLTTYAQPAAGRVLASLLEASASLRVRIDDERCRGRDRWRCTTGRVEAITAEIDHRPRRCLAVHADDGVPVRIDWPAVPTGDVLRGHVGVHDFNRRLRSDAPIELTVRIDDEVQARLLFADTQGWAPFAVRTEPGTHDVAVELVLAARGTWQKDGYDPDREHAPCVELRTIAEEIAP